MPNGATHDRLQMAGSEQSLGSGAVVARPDLRTFANPFQSALNAHLTVIPSAVRMILKQDSRLCFQSPDVDHKGYTSTLQGERAPGGQFFGENPGHEPYYDVNLVDIGKAEPLDRSDKRVKSAIANGTPIGAIEQARTMTSLSHFLELVEKKWVALMVAGTTPFGTATTPLADISVAGAEFDVPASSNIRGVFAQIRRTLPWLRVNAVWGAMDVFDAMCINDEMTRMFGGTVGVGGLSYAQLAQALQLDYVYAGRLADYGDTLVVGAQPAPNTTFVLPDDAPATVYYCYDPQDDGAGDELGIQYSIATDPKSHGKSREVLAHAHCGPALNPVCGIRITDCLV
jgi:hypothetical protein